MPETCAAIVIAAKHGELIKVRDYSGITDTIGALRCKFEFRTNDWDNATMTAVFCKGNMATNPEIVDGAIGVLLDSIDECAVPAEVLTRDAKYFSVGVWGVTAAGFRIVSKWLVFRVEDGCYVDATEPIEPTPTVYEQIMLSLQSKASIDHEHNDIYYKKSEIDSIIEGVQPDSNKDLVEQVEANTMARHKHNNNINVLDKFSEDNNGNPLYNGKEIVSEINETDPTVPSWAKQPDRPKYTAEEVGALPASTKIPSVTSDLTNDSGYINESDVTKILADYRKNDISVPASEVAYSHQLLQDKSGTMKGAFDEAISFVLGVAAPSLHTHSNKDTLDNLSSLFVKNAELTKYAKTEDVYSKKEIDEKGFITLDDIPESDSGKEYVAGDLIEIKDGVIRSTLGDLIEGESVEITDEIFSTESISSMEPWEDKYEYFSEETNKMPDVNEKLLIEFGLANGTKKNFSLDIIDYSDSENEKDKNYVALYNCEPNEEGELLRIDENSEAFILNFFYDNGIENPPTLYMISWEDYTNASIVISQKIIMTTEPSYVRLPDNALGAGNLIEIKDGVIRSTLGDSLGSESVEVIDEIFSADAIPQMEVSWNNPVNYNYIFESEDALLNLPDLNKKFTIEFIKPDGSKKEFKVDLEGKEWEDGGFYGAYLNCEEIEEGKEYYYAKIDETSDALYFFIDTSGGEEPYTYINIVTFEDYTGSALVMGNKVITTNGGYVRLPNEALSLDSVPIEGGIKPITSGGVYDAIQDTKGEMNNVLQNLTAEDIGALPNSVVIPTKVSELENDKNFTSFNDIMAELSEQEYAKQYWVKDLLKGKQDLLLFDTEPTEGSDRPVTSDGIYAALQNVGGGESADPRVTAAQTVALLLEFDGIIEVATEAPDVASIDGSDFAEKLLIISERHYTLLYVPTEDGVLTYTAPFSNPVDLQVFAGGIYEFKYDTDTWQTSVEPHLGVKILELFKSKLFADINIPTKEEIVAEVLAQLPKAEEAEF